MMKRTWHEEKKKAREREREREREQREEKKSGKKCKIDKKNQRIVSQSASLWFSLYQQKRPPAELILEKRQRKKREKERNEGTSGRRTYQSCSIEYNNVRELERKRTDQKLRRNMGRILY